MAGVVAGIVAAFLLWMPVAQGQFNSGSDGHDGALNPTANITIDMADHPDGIYHYTSVNIPTGKTVSFIPNAMNTPVVWLVQGDCTIAGTVSIRGKDGTSAATAGAVGLGGAGGPGGWGGGDMRCAGLGPGAGQNRSNYAAPASHATLGAVIGSANDSTPGPLYGNDYLIPLLGGSGGGGGTAWPSDVNGAGHYGGGGGGGGALLIAASGTIALSGYIDARGGLWYASGGAVRLVASAIYGAGSVGCATSDLGGTSGRGRVRVEALSDLFRGSTTGILTRGMQDIILLPESLNPHLSVASVDGVTVSAIPRGQLPSADITLSGTQQSPFEVVVQCQNIPLNTPITIEVKPQQGSTISVVATNTTGTQASSTAVASVDIPVGGGTISAKTVISIPAGGGGKKLSYRDTGLTSTGERFAKAEIESTVGGGQRITWITESGKRISLGGRL